MEMGMRFGFCFNLSNEMLWFYAIHIMIRRAFSIHWIQGIREV